MIKELSELGKKLRSAKESLELIHNAIKDEPVSIEIVISKEGAFQKFEVFEKKMTRAEAITAKKGKARLLLDKAEEVIGYGGESSAKKHGLFKEKLEKYKDLPELLPVISFYYDNKVDGVEKALIEFEKSIPDEKVRNENICFRVESEASRIHEKPAVLNKIIELYDSSQLKKEKKKCSICGMADNPVVDEPHGMIKKVPDGQMSGCALVSYNENAFESYELNGNQNSSICTNCAKLYVESLNWLLASGNEIEVTTKTGKVKKEFRYTNRKNLGPDTAMVFWTRDNEKVDELDFLEAPDSAEVAKLIDSVKSGNEKSGKYLETDKFYACSLSGAAARISVRDWIETSLSGLRESIAGWFSDISMASYDKDSGKLEVRYSRIYDLARSCQRRNSDGSSDTNDTTLPRVATSLWNAALKGSRPPLWILAKVIQRVSKDDITTERAALIKLILNRNNKGGNHMITEALRKENQPVAYVFGQIFAKLESIQYYALGDRNAGIRERFFTYAMTLPGAAFGKLFDLNSKHYKKLKNEKPGLAVNLDKELQELVKAIDINKMPATFTLEEKGQFAIGYYHQRQEQFAGNKNDKVEEE
ncbi:MAG TPA: type I-C CRISPR-associated protein Cas8c/Csd1 [Candidatus Wallbacteria bacterium]|nr:type I-C CRISPR-associated protein Cas8c/Csd1 [Candidatus Wallbacteria bacterium]